MRSNTTITLKELFKNNFLSPNFKILNVNKTFDSVTAVNIDKVNDKLANNIIQSNLDIILANTLLIKTQADDYYNIGIYLTNIVYDTCNLANASVDNAASTVEFSNTVNNWVNLVNPIVNSRYDIVNTICNNIITLSSNVALALSISTNAYSTASGIYNKSQLALNVANSANDLALISIPIAETANTTSLNIEDKANSALSLSNSIYTLSTNVASLTANAGNITFAISNTAILALNLATNANLIATQAYSTAEMANTIANNIFFIANTASSIANTANLVAYTANAEKGNISSLTLGIINPQLLGSNSYSSSILYGDNSWKQLNANLTSIMNLKGTDLAFRFSHNNWILKKSPDYSTANINIDIQEYSSSITNALMTFNEILLGNDTTLKSVTPLTIAQAATASSGVMEKAIGGKLFKTSGTFTPVISKLHRIIVIGAGGSGAATSVSSFLNPYGMACGGGAGGIAIKDVILSTGTSYTVTIGTGGTYKTKSFSGTSSNGSSGGTSSFSGSDISTISATGGGGGTTGTGGSGGIGSNGDYNFIGGSGGNALYINYGGKLTTGGGAVAVTGITYSAGDCKEGVYNENSIRNCPGASGGAGIGGNSGEVETTYQYCASGGGGSGGNSNSILNPINGLSSGGESSFLIPFDYMYVNNPGGNAGYPSGSNANDGGGGGGGVMNGGHATGGNGGIFGGGGGACCESTNIFASFNATAGNGGIGGGGGGALSVQGTARSGSGGDGLVIILW